MQLATIRVVHLITELDAGGAQTALLRLLEQCTRDQVDQVQPRVVCLYVVCLYNEDKIVAQQIRQLGIPVVGLRMHKGWRVDALWRLYRLIRSQPIDILHCWMFHADIMGRLVGKIANVPVVIGSRRSIAIGGARREQLKRWTAMLDDHVIAVCEMARAAEITRTGAAPEKVTTIYNGIDSMPYNISLERAQQMRQMLGILEDALVVGTVGRLHPVKGYRYLLQAWPAIQQRVPRAKLLIIGDGELRADLEEQAHDLQIAEQLIFTGTRRDIPELLATMDLFILPSLWEGMPNVILEAMAAGVPVLATEVGGTTEIIVDPAYGQLIPPKDPDALATAAIALLVDDKRRQQMARAGQQLVKEEFSIQRTASATLSLYEKLLDISRENAL